MVYDLLVVGNGFDLGCGFKTSYSDFLSKISYDGTRNPLIYFFSSAQRSGYFANDEWNGFETILCQYLQFLDYCFNNTNNVKSSFSDEEKTFIKGVIVRYFGF